MDTPSISIIHADYVRLEKLVGPQLSEDDHSGPRGIYLSPLVHQLRRSPSITKPDGGISTNPESDQPSVEFFGKLLEIQPGLVLWQQMRVTDDRQRERTRWLKQIQYRDELDAREGYAPF